MEKIPQNNLYNQPNDERQPDLPGFDFDKNGIPEENKSDILDQDPVNKNDTIDIKIKPKIDDSYDFNCEICMDQPGGCAQCGWGKN